MRFYLRLILLASASLGAPALAQLGEPIDIVSGVTDLRGAAFADIDGDGHGDLVVALRGQDNVVWMSGLNHFRFGMPHLISENAGGAVDVCVGDFDADGDIDVISATDWRQEIAYFENDGSGTFAAPIVLDSSASSLKRVEAADIDGDGDLDVIGVLGNAVVWYRNTGGAFGPRITVTSTATQLRQVNAADVDGDGDVDLLSAGDTGFHWYVNDGVGGFPMTLQVGAPVTNGRAIVSCDFDGDGQREIVTVTNAANGLVWFGVQIGGGSPALTLEGFEPGWDAQSLESGDLDGDGRVELGYATPNAAGYVRMSPSGQVSRWRASASLTNGKPAKDVLLVDGDADGDLDLIWTTGTENRVFAGEQTFPLGFALNEALSFNADSLDSAFTDFDGDGDEDLLRLHSGGNTYRRLSIMENIGDGNFGEQHFLNPALASNTGEFSAGDLDGDGDADVVMSRGNIPIGSPGMIIVENLGGTLANPVVLPTNLTATLPIIADVDADGSADLIYSERPLGSGLSGPRELKFARNLGGLQFATPTLIDSLLAPNVLRATDVTGDGRADLLVQIQSVPSGAPEGFPLVFYPSDATSPTGFGPRVDLGESTWRTRSAIFADLNGDGQKDVVQTTRVTPGIFELRWSENVGGVFTGTTFLASVPADLTDIVAMDWGADGDEDLFSVRAISPSGSEIVLREWIDPTGLAAPVVVPLAVPFDPIQLMAADIDGDLDSDLVLTSSGLGTEQTRWYENTAAIGATTCPSVPNSTGDAAAMHASGSVLAVNDTFALNATSLPALATTLFLTSTSTGLTPNPAGSQGVLCLGGGIVRFTKPGEVKTASASGQARLVLDLTAIPTNAGSVVVMSGQTRFFQAWFRDINPLQTSNFTSAITVTFR